METKIEGVYLYGVGATKAKSEEQVGKLVSQSELHGWVVMGIYSDVSQRQTSRLSDLHQLLKDLPPNEPAVILAGSMHLLLRSFDAYALVPEIENGRVSLIDLKGDVINASPSISLLLMLHRLKSETAGRRIKFAKEQASLKRSEGKV